MSDRPQDALPWRKAKASNSGSCVEVAARGGYIYVRDSKRPNGSVLEFTTHEWTAFLNGVGNEEFTLQALAN